MSYFKYNRFTGRTIEQMEEYYLKERERHFNDFASAEKGDPILDYGLEYVLNELDSEYEDALEDLEQKD